MRDKLNIVFKPFLIALIGLAAGYSFLHWVLFIRFGIFHLKENITEILLPFVLSGIVVLFFIRPKVKALRLRVPFIYFLVAWLGLIIPTVLAQEYMVMVTGRLTRLYSIGEIGNHEPTKYYEATSYHINTKNKYYYATYKVSGKKSEYFNMYLYAVMPIYETVADTVSDTPSAWLGLFYKDRVSNRISNESKEEMFNLFIRQNQARIEYEDFSSFVYFERIGRTSKHYAAFQNALIQSGFSVSDGVILKGVSEPYESRGKDSLKRLLTAMLIVTLLWLLMSVVPKTDPKELRRIKAGKPDKAARRERGEILAAAIPHEGFFITPILIYINTAVFLLMVFSGLGFITFQADDLLNWGACYGPEIRGGQWWRLLVSTFLHGGAMHLIANMLCLIVLGVDLEGRMSRVQYLCVYLFSGLVASMTSVWWHDTPVVSVGASGAIFGLCGAFVALLLTKVYPSAYVKSLLKGVAVFIGTNLLIGMTAGIDNAAHVGGLLGGFILGLTLSPFIKKQDEK